MTFVTLKERVEALTRTDLENIAMNVALALYFDDDGHNTDKVWDMDTAIDCSDAINVLQCYKTDEEE